MTRPGLHRTQVLWPIAVDDRLDNLRDLVLAQGERASRAELLATLVWHAPTDGEGLGVMVRTYRREASGAAPGRRQKRTRPGPRPVDVNR
jgi:hypothetical protein